jgi:hypothetical protein
MPQSRPRSGRPAAESPTYQPPPAPDAILDKIEHEGG